MALILGITAASYAVVSYLSEKLGPGRPD